MGYDQKADIWAVGCLLFELLTGMRQTPQSSYGKLFDLLLQPTLFCRNDGFVWALHPNKLLEAAVNGTMVIVAVTVLCRHHDRRYGMYTTANDSARQGTAGTAAVQAGCLTSGLPHVQAAHRNGASDLY